MAITKQKKQDILAKLEKEVVPAQTVVFASFKGVPVLDITAFRKDLRSKDTGYYVAKKTLIRRAFAGGKVEGTMPELDGEVAVAYSQDQLAPAKGVYEFAKKNPERMKIVGGVFEGKFMDAAAMIAIAAIPGREVLYGQFVNVINSPIQGLVIALDAIAKTKSE